MGSIEVENSYFSDLQAFIHTKRDSPIQIEINFIPYEIKFLTVGTRIFIHIVDVLNSSMIYYGPILNNFETLRFFINYKIVNLVLQS